MLSPTTQTGRWSGRLPLSCWPTPAPIPVQPGQPRRQDYEYRRGGTRNIFLTRTPGGLANVANRATHHGRLCQPDAVAGGRGLPRCSGGPRGAGQSEYPSYGLPLRDLPRRRSSAHREAAGISPHCPSTPHSGNTILHHLCTTTRRPFQQPTRATLTCRRYWHRTTVAVPWVPQ